MALLQGFLRAQDPRTPETVEDEVRDELEFHIEMRAREYVEQGMTAGEARRAAEARFGDVALVSKECKNIQLGERIMLQRIQSVLIVVLTCAVGILGYETISARRESAASMRKLSDGLDQLAARMPGPQSLSMNAAELERLRQAMQSAGAEKESREPLGEEVGAGQPVKLRIEDWLARFAELPNSGRHARKVAAEIAQLSPDEGLRVMKELWPVLSLVHREQVLKPFVYAHPHLVELLDLAARDEWGSVQAGAFQLLSNVAFQDFSTDFDAYIAWSAKYKGMPMNEVVTENAKDFIGRLRALSGDDLASTLAQTRAPSLVPAEDNGIDLRALLRENGGLELVESWLAREGLEVEERALDWVATLAPDEGWMRRNVLPIFEETDDASRLGNVCEALGKPHYSWARPEVTSFLERRLAVTPKGDPDGPAWSAARSLAAMADTRAIPTMIGMICADDSYNTVYGVGYFGLSKLTGIPYDESHNGAWWRTWWQDNKHRFGAEVEGLEVPAYDF